MEQFRECDDSVSPVIGVVLLLGLTVLMVSLVAVSVFAFEPPQPAPHARIVVVEARGDIDKPHYKNIIVLKHKGGDNLFENNTKIIIVGEGYVHTEEEIPNPPVHDIRITYRDLTGKNYYRDDNFTSKEIVDGTSWDAGEIVELYGRDGINIGSPIIHNQGNTVDFKWKLAAGSKVSVMVIDKTTDQIIASVRTNVKEV